MNDKFLTDLDKLGMELASKKNLEKQTGILIEPKLYSKTAFLESMQDLLKRDKRRQEDGFPSKIKFRKVLTSNNKVISVGNRKNPLNAG